MVELGIGILIGLALSLVALVSEIALSNRGSSLAKKVREKTQERGGIIEEDNSDNIIREITNDEQ